MAIKTLHLTNAFHACSGGISTFYMAMLEEANRQQREMRLIVPGAEDRVEQVGKHGRIYFVRAHIAPLNGSYRCVYPIQYLCPEDTMRTILREERPDLIEVCDKYNLHFLSGMIRENLLKDIDFRPVMLGLSCERMDENVAAYVGDSVLHRLFCRWYMHWLYFPFFDHHLAVSEHAAAELVSASTRHRVRRGIWIRPMGVDAARFSPARRTEVMRRALLQQCNACSRSTLLLYVGRLAPEKNLSLLLRMMQLLGREGNRDYRLMMVGDGIERERLERLATELAPGKVYFLHHITDRERLAEVYASCDLFVHPNPREPFGIAPLEAMASGLPLVGANSGGITSFANEANAWLAEPDAESFSAAVRHALDDDRARGEKALAALETAARNNWDSAARAYFTLYDAIHARFWGLDLPAHCPPYAWSSQGTSYTDAMIEVSSVFAQTLCRAAVSVTRQTRDLAPEDPTPRYMQMVPSVTGREEKRRPFCIQEGQT
ncbi:MAG: glycosyltransferase [Acidobacteriaceae bacterium]